jgi:HPr kinase/phosphorylase
MLKEINGITVSHFYETYRDKLKMELVIGEAGLHRLIREGSINRPSLALTGFFKYFANKRIQVLGAAEMTYLKTLNQKQQIDILDTMVRRYAIPCLVLTRNFQPTHPMLAVAEERKLPIFRTPMITMNWVNVATLCIDNEFAPSTTEHATTLDVKGIGVMIRGDSGIGKSECALALIERGHSLVADDLTCIRLMDERELLASSRALNRGYMECRGIGIINIAEMFGVKSIRLDKRIDLVVSLREWSPDVIEERTGLEENYYNILGVRVPHMEFYVRPGRDIARLIEVAALVQALKMMGHDPAKNFNERLIAHMAEQKVAPATSHKVADEPPFPDDDDDPEMDGEKP